MAESNDGMYALFMCNRYLIIRHKFEEYLDGLAVPCSEDEDLLLNEKYNNSIQ